MTSPPIASRAGLAPCFAQVSRRDIARRLALVPQDTHSAFDFSVLDMVLMGRYPHLGTFALEGADDVAIARDALAATGTASFELNTTWTLGSAVGATVISNGAALLLPATPVGAGAKQADGAVTAASAGPRRWQ